MKLSIKNWLNKQNDSDRILADITFAETRRKIKDIFGEFKEELQDSSTNSTFVTNKAEVYREIILHFAIAIAFPNKMFNGRPYFAEESFKALLRKMVAEMELSFKNEKDAMKFEDKAVSLVDQIIDVIARARGNLPIPEPDFVKDDHIEIKTVPEPDEGVDAKNGTVESKESIKEDNESGIEEVFEKHDSVEDIVKDLVENGESDTEIIKLVQKNKGVRAISKAKLKKIKASIT